MISPVVVREMEDGSSQFRLGIKQAVMTGKLNSFSQLANHRVLEHGNRIKSGYWLGGPVADLLLEPMSSSWKG